MVSHRLVKQPEDINLGTDKYTRKHHQCTGYKMQQTQELLQTSIGVQHRYPYKYQ